MLDSGGAAAGSSMAASGMPMGPSRYLWVASNGRDTVFDTAAAACGCLRANPEIYLRLGFA